VVAAPDFFTLDSGGVVESLQAEVSADRLLEVEEAARACPTQVIMLENS
jgi:ferredoxin